MNIDKAVTTEGNMSHGIYDGKKKSLSKGGEMEENEVTDVENVEKSDEELITKSDIAELTKAILELQKSFASHFSSLTTPQPQSIGGKGHEVKDTMQKAEDVPENNYELIVKAQDAKILELQEMVKKMGDTKIEKGGTAIIIPEHLEKGDPVLTNLSILSGAGRMTK